MIHAQEPINKNVFMMDFSRSAAGTLLSCLEGIEKRSVAQKSDKSICAKTITILQNDTTFNFNITEIIASTLAEDYKLLISHLKSSNHHDSDLILWVFSSDEPHVARTYDFINQRLYPAIYGNKSPVELPPTIIIITKINQARNDYLLDYLINVAKKLPYICAIIEGPTNNKNIITKLKTIMVQYCCAENAANYHNPNFQTITPKVRRQYSLPVIPTQIPVSQREKVRQDYAEWQDKKYLWDRLKTRWRTWKISQEFRVFTLHGEKIEPKNLTECHTPTPPREPNFTHYLALHSESSSSSESPPSIASPVNFVSAVPIKNSSRAQQKQQMIQQMTCKSCFEKAISAILQPCGHAICTDCAKTITAKTQAKCPFCIENIFISGFQLIYFPVEIFL